MSSSVQELNVTVVDRDVGYAERRSQFLARCHAPFKGRAAQEDLVD